MWDRDEHLAIIKEMREEERADAVPAVERKVA
jgi:hypothetical protein